MKVIGMGVPELVVIALICAVLVARALRTGSKKDDTGGVGAGQSGSLKSTMGVANRGMHASSHGTAGSSAGAFGSGGPTGGGGNVPAGASHGSVGPGSYGSAPGSYGNASGSYGSYRTGSAGSNGWASSQQGYRTPTADQGSAGNGFAGRGYASAGVSSPGRGGNAGGATTLDARYARYHNLWVCRYCETLNDDQYDTCEVCGRQMDLSEWYASSQGE